MAEKRRGLGRTLETLLSGSAPSSETSSQVVENKENSGIAHLPVTSVAPGQYQPRRDFDEETLQNLAESIKSQGILQPIVVRKLASGNHEIIAGERRWRAAQLADLKEVPVIVKELSDEHALAIGLIENIQRENLNALEEAVALQRLVDEFQLTHQEVAQSVGRSRATVSNMLRILSLNPDVKTLLEHGDLELGHAKALLALSGQKQSAIARVVVAKGLSVRETEKLVKQTLNPSVQPTKEKVTLDPDIQRLQKRLSERLGAQVTIQVQNKGKGKLIINYNNLDELDGILAHIESTEPVS